MKKIPNYKSFLEEVELNLAELGKVRDNEKRGDVLVRKLKDDPSFTTNNNKNIEVDKMKDEEGNWVEPSDVIDDITTDGEYDPDKAKKYFTKGTRYEPVFKDEDGGEFRLNQFKKTKEFGSAGAGRLVKQFESVQCIFLAIKQVFPERYLGSSNLIRFFNEFVNYPSNLVHLPDVVMKEDEMRGFKIDENLMNDFLQDPNWLETFFKIPNRLWTKTGNYIDTSLGR